LNSFSYSILNRSRDLSSDSSLSTCRRDVGAAASAGASRHDKRGSVHAVFSCCEAQKGLHGCCGGRTSWKSACSVSKGRCSAPASKPSFAFAWPSISRC
jgi:hypothetical protein